ncbi:ATP-binding cassette domain-containing protein [Klugiella xanthotipulae]|uniref:Monosaccharide ABC transporter ATP-binding protein (CUT2 family) n=1 Tax=Klugiella xanthotipulae TaxID=244735 RepID=A0A543I468_9MICO|nr:ATP-binding cassette domain-containing protein [Klugiella xanthotipulae]TQM65389.1 monosaccharide ABC transporter ATP-binding protein (CUT2 family) [Klugiella xanthotipulae]
MSGATPPRPGSAGTPLIEARGVGRSYGSIVALHDVSARVLAGEVLCVLGDNGAGKSTLISILSGAQPHGSGEFLVDGQPTRLSSPREARDHGIATVYQDLAVVPLMSVWRNFFLGSELTVGHGPLRRLDVARMRSVASAELARMGIQLRDLEQPIGTLSGGERQSVAIARAVYFGARVVILDEPTAALGVKQAGIVLRDIARARDRGLGVVFVTHNPHHAYPVGDTFLLLGRGEMLGTYARGEITVEELTRLMAGGSELDDLTRELGRHPS